MRTMVAMLAAVLLQLPPAAQAACSDPSAVTNARAAIAFSCCPGATSHGSFMHCANAVITIQVGAMLLPPDCKGDVRRCASRSTCGRPGAVTCCRTRSNGATRCVVKRSAALCTPPAGGSACVGTPASCCDACTGSGCVTTSTVTTTSTTTSSTVATPCDGTFPSCNGSCPPGFECHIEENFPPQVCGCFPAGVVPCSSSTFPECGGTCSGTGVCGPVHVYFTEFGDITYCTCLDPTSNCTGSFQGGMCPGLCPDGSACYGEPDPGGLGNCVGCIPTCFPFCGP